MMATQKRIKVLYIAGWGRSGTTLLDNIFGQLNGFFSVGEIRFIWERNFLEDRSCGCGQLFSSCTTWQNIVQDAFGDAANLDAESLGRIAHTFTSTRSIPRFIKTHGTLRGGRDFDSYLSVLTRLYASIAKCTNSRVIVDSSKFPVYGGILRLIPNLDVYIIHMVRDPRAVAYSWMQPKHVESPDLRDKTEAIGPLMSSALWVSWNITLNFMKSLLPGRYKLLRYEDFVINPLNSIKDILAFMDEPSDGLPFMDDFIVKMESNHTLSGNLNRFNLGPVEIKPDTRWQSQLSPFHRILVTIISWPLMNFFGYRP